MPCKIHNAHPLLGLKDKVQEICESFLTVYHLSFFQLRRNYGNGRFSALSTNPVACAETLENYLSYPFYERKNIETCGTVYMVNDRLPPIVASCIERKYKIYDGITFVHFYENYYDAISYGLPEKCSMATTYYASILKDLEDFCMEFYLKAAPLLDVIEKKPIIVSNQANEGYLTSLPDGGYEVQGRFGSVALNVDELAFLQSLHRGKTKIELSKIFSLPVQMIDKKITHLEQKTGYPIFFLKPQKMKSSS